MSENDERAVSPPRRRRWSRRKFFGLALFAIAGLAAIALGAAYFALLKIADSTLTEAIAETDSLDSGWRLEDLKAAREKREIPPEEDAAARVIRVLSLTPDVVPPPRVTGLPPSPSQIAALDSAFANYPDNMVLGSDQFTALKQLIDRNKEALEEARPLSELSRGRYHLNYAINPLETLLPHTQDSRDVARLLRLDALLRAETQEMDVALEDVRAIIGVAHSIDDEPTAISQLVRIAEVNVAIKTLERILAQGSGSDAALAKVQKRLNDEAKVPFNLIAMRAERAVSFDLLGKLADGTITTSDITYAVPKEMKSVVTQTPHGQAFCRYNQGLSLKMMNKAVEISRLPVSEQVQKWKTWENDAKLPVDSWGKLTKSLTYLLIPALGAMATAHIRINAILGCAEIMVAMERYRIKNGGWPDSLEAIPRSILERIPIDPYSGKPLRAIRKEDGWVVYSVGPNGEDDHGELDLRFDPKTEGSDWGLTLYDPSYRLLPPFYDQELPAQPFVGEPLLDDSTVMPPELRMDTIP